MQINTLLNEREKTHGRWEENAHISQGLLRILRTGCRWADLTDSQLEALQMISHKKHRIVNGDPNVPDHWDDIAGYATLEANRLRAILKANSVVKSVSGETTGDVGQNGGTVTASKLNSQTLAIVSDLYTGPVQDFAASPPPWPHIARSVVGGLLGAETVYLPDRSRIAPEVIEEQLCRLDGKLPRLDYETLHPALRTLYVRQTDGDEYVLLPEFAGWAS